MSFKVSAGRSEAVYLDLMDEIRSSTGDTPLSAALQDRLERLPKSTRRAIVSRTHAGCAPLFLCARRGNAEIADYLVHVCDAPLEQRGVYEEPGAEHHVTPLWCAAAADSQMVLRVLADAGANLDAVSDTGSTPVRSACCRNNEEVVWELVERGANIHLANHNSSTCLMASTHSATLCDFLISKGADVNACDLQHMTALHYAAQEHREATVRLLLDHGADPHRVSHSGDDVLRTAALKGADNIVSLLATRAIYSLSQLADAYELLGATQIDEFNDFTAAISNWRRATALRHITSSYVEKLPERSPQSALDNAREWRTAEQLDSIAVDVEAMRVQSLLIALRVLGPAREDTMLRLMYCGASFADAHRYDRCIELWTLALEIRIERDTLLDTDTWHTAYALTRIMLDGRLGRLEGGRGVPSFKDVARVFELVAGQLPDARRMLMIRPVFLKQAETFDCMLHCVTHLTYLLLETAETHEEQATVHIGVRGLIVEDIRSAHTGETLLHLCVSRQHRINSSYFDAQPAVPAIFPSIPVVQLLTRCGADPLQRDESHSTALHVAAAAENYSPELISCLLSAGGHIDQVNRFGETALEIVTARSNHQLYPLRHLTLGCLAARALLADSRHSNIRRGDIPTTLHEFLELHRRTPPA